MRKKTPQELLMKIYVNGKLRAAVKGPKNVYVIDLKEGQSVDYIIESEKIFMELDIFRNGKFQFYISPEGNPFCRRLDE